jgi:hypothetical protein
MFWLAGSTVAAKSFVPAAAGCNFLQFAPVFRAECHLSISLN